MFGSAAESSMAKFPLFIDGATVETAQWSDVIDPAAPRQTVGQAGSASAADSERAVLAAQRAWPAWSGMRPQERAAALVGALASLERGYDQRVELLVRENGKPRGEASVELGVFEWRCRLAAALADRLDDVEEYPVLQTRDEPAASPGSAGARSAANAARRSIEAGVVQHYKAPPLRSQVMRMSLGVVTIIVPYNWPLAILAASLPYALIAGNPVIVKPPPSCPLAVLETIARVGAQLPRGVLQVVAGSNDAVAPLIRHPAVAKIVFTGSSPAGAFMMKTASETLKRVTLELGGNDPAIVLDDAMLDDEALERITLASFLTAGQVCMGIKRIYVHRSRYTELVDGMEALLRTYRVRHGLGPATTMGPLNNAKQRDIVRTLVEDARSRGAEIRTLGAMDPTADPSGFFHLPTLVLAPPDGARIIGEEQFGPALPIMPYDDVDRVIESTNAEWAGLCSSVWTSDPARAADVARRLRTGTTWVNNANAVTQDDRVPFGGFRQSGVGRELGTDGLFDFTEAHSITYPAAPPR
jgi:acyl-CoA reductase-like NAD-dependent aldehyde dehydrogenase